MATTSKIHRDSSFILPSLELGRALSEKFPQIFGPGSSPVYLTIAFIVVLPFPMLSTKPFWKTTGNQSCPYELIPPYFICFSPFRDHCSKFHPDLWILSMPHCPSKQDGPISKNNRIGNELQGMGTTYLAQTSRCSFLFLRDLNSGSSFQCFHQRSDGSIHSVQSWILHDGTYSQITGCLLVSSCTMLANAFKN